MSSKKHIQRFLQYLFKCTRCDINVTQTIVLVPTGRVTHVQVTPTVVSASGSDLRQLSVNDRQCRFRDEGDGVMEIIKEYTENGCRYCTYYMKVLSVMNY